MWKKRFGQACPSMAKDAIIRKKKEHAKITSFSALSNSFYINIDIVCIIVSIFIWPSSLKEVSKEGGGDPLPPFRPSNL